MGFLRQILATLIVLTIAAGAWLWLDEAPGRFVQQHGDRLPAPVRNALLSLSPITDAPQIGATPRSETADRALPLVVVDPAVPDVTRDRLRGLGTGEAERSVAVYPDATGIVTSVDFQSGERVEQGQILAVLQNDTERLALDRARIALAAAQDQVARYETLSSSAAITAVQLEEVRRLAETARLDVRSAEIALENRNIVAPISGHVGLVGIDVGALVSNQTLIATVDDRDRLKVVFNTPEGFLAGLRVGHPVVALPTTRSGRSYDGEISALDSRIDEASRTLRTEALIDNVDDQLRPGMSFNVEIAFPGEEFLSVDPLAIQWERAGSYVWVVRDEHTVKAPVRIIERNIERVLVASDELRPQDSVVTEGVQQLREGVPVRLREQPMLPVPDTPESDSIPSAGAEPALVRPANASERRANGAALPQQTRQLASRDRPGEAEGTAP